MLTEEKAERDAQLIGKHLKSSGERSLVRGDPSHGDSARRRLHERGSDPDAHGVEDTEPTRTLLYSTVHSSRVQCCWPRVWHEQTCFRQH